MHAFAIYPGTSTLHCGMVKILTIEEIDMQNSYPITSPPSSNSPLYTKAASPSYFLTSAGCFVARNFTSSVSLSRVASLSWPGGVGAITSARIGRRVGVREMIVGLDSWSVWMMGLVHCSSLVLGVLGW